MQRRKVRVRGSGRGPELGRRVGINSAREIQAIAGLGIRPRECAGSELDHRESTKSDLNARRSEQRAAAERSRRLDRRTRHQSRTA